MIGPKEKTRRVGRVALGSSHVKSHEYSTKARRCLHSESASGWRLVWRAAYDRYARANGSAGPPL